MNKTYHLHFYGYTWHEFVYYVKKAKGIVLVYKGDKTTKEEYKMTELLYVGYTNDLCSFSESDLVSMMLETLKGDERLFYSYAETEEDEELLNYLIYKLNPKYNKSANSVCTDMLVEISGEYIEQQN